MTTASYTYVGSELDLFAAARNWKSYFRDRIAPFLGSEVLEVGAGLGGTTRTLCRGSERRWVCLEPDPALASRLGGEIAAKRLPGCCEVRVGTLNDSSGSPEFDTVLYMDVLEHIEDDRAEVARAAALLRPGGHIVALSPAHQWLYSPFDRAIGHCRRYSRASFGALAGPGLERVRLDYLDSVGLLASLGNRVLLRSDMPKPSQIAFWDNVLVRASRFLDPILGHGVGKSVLAVWKKVC
jgi:SAM-dependent methyltransferase